MQIQAFHRKFTSTAESCNLFQALRQLSLVDNFKSMFSADGDNPGDILNDGWPNWGSGVEAKAACEA